MINIDIIQTNIVVVTIPDCQNSMINHSTFSTRVIIKYSLTVQLKAKLICLHGDTGWLHDNRGEKTMFVSFGDVNIALYL